MASWKPSAPVQGRPAPPRTTSNFKEALPPMSGRASPPLIPIPLRSSTNNYQQSRNPGASHQKYQPLPLSPPDKLPERVYAPFTTAAAVPTPPPKVNKPAPPSPKKNSRQRANTLTGSLNLVRAEVARIESPREKEIRIETEFDQLLDSMQLPQESVRQKMKSVDISVKEQMLSSSSLVASNNSRHARGMSLNSSLNTLPHQQPLGSKKEGGSIEGKSTSSSSKRPFLRKTKSQTSLKSSNNNVPSTAPVRPTHSRTTSATSLFRSLGRSSSGNLAATAVNSAVANGNPSEEDATWWAVRIRSTRSEQLVVKEVGRLRGRLRSESPNWVKEFITHGGYTGLLERLKELLDVEWREEQHDDQVLHELLRCLKALTLTSCGKRALSSRSPSPFVALTSLLFSEKRPGDLPCRQLLVELVHSLFEICPSNAAPIDKNGWTTTINLQSPELGVSPTIPPPSGVDGDGKGSEGKGSGGVRRYLRKAKSGDDSPDLDDPVLMGKVHSLVFSLMVGPPDEKTEAKVDFAKGMVRKRIFKKWVIEMSDCVRDYFWIFCHAQNVYWNLNQVDPVKIEAPQVPSGMTGGVEFEAMTYCTVHLRLVNAIARTCPDAEAAFQFHDQLFESGFEHVLFTLRRASTTYYAPLHLELARYINLARSSGFFLLPPRILGWIDPSTLCREERHSLDDYQRRKQVSHTGAPQLAAPSF
ncbi:hypothetical protein T439DRAFT_329352 [Meredithblackwellia eburnea MCA 4105]